MIILSKDIYFPPVHHTEPDGFFAVGGDLSPERLLLAYKKGIFPWFNQDEPICWYCPDPRFILLPEELKISKSMKNVIRSDRFSFSINNAFADVVYNCQTTVRKYGSGTWISDQILEAYKSLFEKGFAESVEVWQKEELVGGLYGVKLGNVFFGESMFTKRSNASKFALIKYVEVLKSRGVKLIDCQVYTPHLESLGAKLIPRAAFLGLLEKYI